MGSFSLWHWIIVLIVVLLVFGTKRLRNVGEDLGSAIKGFKKGLKDGQDEPPAQLGDESRQSDEARKQSERKDA